MRRLLCLLGFHKNIIIEKRFYDEKFDITYVCTKCGHKSYDVTPWEEEHD